MRSLRLGFIIDLHNIDFKVTKRRESSVKKKKRGIGGKVITAC